MIFRLQKLKRKETVCSRNGNSPVLITSACRALNVQDHQLPHSVAVRVNDILTHHRRRKDVHTRVCKPRYTCILSRYTLREERAGWYVVPKQNKMLPWKHFKSCTWEQEKILPKSAKKYLIYSCFDKIQFRKQHFMQSLSTINYIYLGRSSRALFE